MNHLRAIPRALHLIDLENLGGCASLTEQHIGWIRESYEEAAVVGYGDHVVTATAHRSAKAALFGWPNARQLIRSGPDGADQALLDVVLKERVAERYSTVVIGSGDGIFALPAARLQEDGVEVRAVSLERALSRKRRLAVRDVRFLDRPARSDLAA